MATDKELSPLDRIDGELLKLFIERMAAAERSDPRRDPVREREIMNRIARTCSGDTAKAARLFYFGKAGKGAAAEKLKVDRKTFYRMRVKLVELTVKYIALVNMALSGK